MSDFSNEPGNVLDKYKKDQDLSKLLSSLDGLGEEQQREAGESLEALKRPVKEMMQDQSNQLPTQLHQLKETVSQLEPNYLKTSQSKNG
ncbi:tellurite resistance protein [Halalkalibacter akibai JCM 9157]|uniref:Tellurite resistance protein n=1 Tax=Halalkalibacter akibai (strain ATCC 43226 / DSM 21942 / CIP 109018 / JCM 9157 / 1139) TaxID=1236973 RepID=W4QRB0_HALA3|nr:tellurite resistance protein [Halalkalibacter akibai JCM 9157]